MWNPKLIQRNPNFDARAAFDCQLKPESFRFVLDGRLNISDPQVSFLCELATREQFEIFRPKDAEHLTIGVPFFASFDPLQPKPIRELVTRWIGSCRISALTESMWVVDTDRALAGAAIPVADLNMNSALTDIARALRADLVVGINPQEPSRGLPEVVSVPWALALMGLHSRAVGNNPVAGSESSSFDIGVKLGRWLEAVRSLETLWGTKLALNGPTENTSVLLQAVIERMMQLLKARDDAMLSALQTDKLSLYDGVAALESGALASKAALDAMARAVNAALDLGVNRNGFGWRKDSCLMRELRIRAPEAADLILNSSTQNFLKVIADLRNTIHAESIGVAAYGSTEGTKNLARVPPDLVDAMSGCISELGLRKVWCLDSTNTLLLDPVQVLHDLALWTASLLNAFCMAIPWPAAKAPLPFRSSTRDDIRWEQNVDRTSWLYGLDVWATPVPTAWRNV